MIPLTWLKFQKEHIKYYPAIKQTNENIQWYYEHQIIEDGDMENITEDPMQFMGTIKQKKSSKKKEMKKEESEWMRVIYWYRDIRSNSRNAYVSYVEEVDEDESRWK